MSKGDPSAIKKMKGYSKEVLAELTGDARLRDEGRKEIAEGRLSEGAPAAETSAPDGTPGTGSR